MTASPALPPADPHGADPHGADPHGADPHASQSVAPESAVAATPPAPLPGTNLGGRIVRRAGTFPYSGLRYVVFRQTGRDQMAAHAQATAAAVAERGAGAQAAPMQVGLHVVASTTGIERSPGSGVYEPVSYDQLLDLDTDDLDALGDEAPAAVPQ